MIASKVVQIKGGPHPVRDGADRWAWERAGRGLKQVGRNGWSMCSIRFWRMVLL